MSRMAFPGADTEPCVFRAVCPLLTCEKTEPRQTKRSFFKWSYNNNIKAKGLDWAIILRLFFFPFCRFLLSLVHCLTCGTVSEPSYLTTKLIWIIPFPFPWKNLLCLSRVYYGAFSHNSEDFLSLKQAKAAMLQRKQAALRGDSVVSPN